MTNPVIFALREAPLLLTERQLQGLVFADKNTVHVYLREAVSERTVIEHGQTVTGEMLYGVPRDTKLHAK